MAEQNYDSNYYEIQRVTGAYDTYIIGRFRQPGLFVLGVMDLGDAKAWQGQVSDLVLYFVITPEEYRWLREDRERLDDLAHRLQNELPRSRFVAGILNRGVDREKLRETCQSMLKSDQLANDQAFAAWKEAHPFRKRSQLRTPLTDARHDLAVFQKELKSRAADGMDQQELNRRQRTLANRMLEREALFAAMDENSPGGEWPGLEYAEGVAQVFSCEENAVTACEFYAKQKLFSYRVQRVEREQYPAFFGNCQALGVTILQLDDGVEPARVELSYLCPDSEENWLEERNRQVRNVMLRCASVSGQVARHGGEMSEQLRENLTLCMTGLRVNMLREVGNGLFYVPCALPEELKLQFQEDLVFTKAALDRLKEDLARHKRPQSALTDPHFAGRVASVHSSAEGKLPLRLIEDEQEQRWMVAFTSSRQCKAFLERSREEDTMVVFTLDELNQQVEGVSGLVLDLFGLGLQLKSEDMERCLQVRTLEKMGTRREKTAASKEKRTENGKKTDPEPQPEEPVSPEKGEEENHDSVPDDQKVPADAGKKVKRRGLFEWLFRRKR